MTIAIREQIADLNRIIERELPHPVDTGDWDSVNTDTALKGLAESLLPSMGKLLAVSDALQALLDRYVGLVNCGDCGHWDPEKEDEVIAARAALARVQTRHGIRHVTTGDVRLELGWTQEECDEADDSGLNT